MKFSVIVGIIVAAVIFTGVKKTENSNPNNIILTESNLATLSDEVNGESVGSAISELRNAVKKKSQPILFLDTPGGDIQAGLELNEAVRGLGVEVKTITFFAASMGFQIAQDLGERLIVKNGTLMSHKARGQVSGEFGGQGPSQMDNRLNFWKQRLHDMDLQTVDRTNGKQTIQSYQAAYENELWLTGPQAVENGYADRIVTVSCDNSLHGVKTKTATFFGMEIRYDLDKCPLNTTPKNVRMKVETTKGIMYTNEFIEKGGIFGPACLMSKEADKICLMDTSLTPTKLEDVKNKFINNYLENKQKVIYMTIPL